MPLLGSFREILYNPTLFRISHMNEKDFAKGTEKPAPTDIPRSTFLNSIDMLPLGIE